jgi:hypothetical protein
MVRVALLCDLRGLGLFICILLVLKFYYKRIVPELACVVKGYLYVLRVFDDLVGERAKRGQNTCLIFKQSWKLGKYPPVDIDLSEFLKKDPF